MAFNLVDTSALPGVAPKKYGLGMWLSRIPNPISARNILFLLSFFTEGSFL